MIWVEEVQGELSDSPSHRIWFLQIAYSSVLLLWLGFIVGLKLELKVGLLLWLELGVGLKLELGVGLKLEGSFPFLN